MITTPSWTATRRRGAVVLGAAPIPVVAMWLALAGLALAAPQEQPQTDEPAPDAAKVAETAVALPMTFEKVWFREARRKGFGKLKAFKHSGFLTVTEDGLDFVGEKHSYFFPIDDVEMLSIGNLPGDVNTEWVVFSVREEGGTRVAGLRDGHAWGYGKETIEIYRNLKEALKQLRAGPYATAPGYRTYDRLADQVVLHYPEGWSAFVVRAVYVGSGVAYGRVVFSPRDVDSLSAELKEQRALPTVEQGDELAIVFDRAETTKGMTCDKLTPPARASILERVGALPVFADAAAVLAPPAAEETRIAGCEGLRIRGRTRGSDGRERAVDLRTFAHRDTLFTLGFRVPADVEPQAGETLDRMAASVLLPLAWSD